MKKLAFAISLAVAGAAGASAADLPIKARPMAAEAVYSWSGFYIGGNAGGSFGERVATDAMPDFAAPTFATEAATSSTLATDRGNGTSFIGGFQIGYNWQVSSQYVLGIETDIQGLTVANRTISSPVPLFPNETIFSTTNSAPTYLGTVRGRAGFLASPALLLYATGGLAYGQRASTGQIDIDTPSPFCAFDGGICNPYSAGFGVQFGYTVGVGGEWMIRPNWSLKAEYLYYNLGSSSSTTLTNLFGNTSGIFIAGQPAWSSALQSRWLDGNIVRLGVNYHFGAAPVVARY
jgi:outer membrane immunogenic protein